MKQITLKTGLFEVVKKYCSTLKRTYPTIALIIAVNCFLYILKVQLTIQTIYAEICISDVLIIVMGISCFLIMKKNAAQRFADKAMPLDILAVIGLSALYAVLNNVLFYVINPMIEDMPALTSLALAILHLVLFVTIYKKIIAKTRAPHTREDTRFLVKYICFYSITGSIFMIILGLLLGIFIPLPERQKCITVLSVIPELLLTPIIGTYYCEKEQKLQQLGI